MKQHLYHKKKDYLDSGLVSKRSQSSGITQASKRLKNTRKGKFSIIRRKELVNWQQGKNEPKATNHHGRTHETEFGELPRRRPSNSAQSSNTVTHPHTLHATTSGNPNKPIAISGTILERVLPRLVYFIRG
ncbi:hypothetical protein BDFG_01880 [Blastomyces dermatitidis ATCC 26199]|nr:hypothetical protein BDFG_01880 [Blastomyces dermatitidis ATCC 26199]